jgi:MATE family multidrug resistance protein
MTLLHKILKLALPMLITQLINIGGGFFCMAMLSHLGPKILAASALIFAAQQTFMVIGMSFLFSISMLVGRAYGAKEYSKIGSIVQHGWSLGLAISIPLIILYLNMGALLVHFGQDPALAAIVQEFFNIYVWEIPVFMLLVCNQQLFFGMHQQKLALTTSVISLSVLLTTAWVLIFGKLGLPSLGVKGLALAMVVQCYVAFLLGAAYLYFHEDFKKLELFRFRPHKKYETFKHMFKVALPIGIQISSEVPSFFVNSIMVGWIGVQALMASQVVTQYMFLFIVPIFGLAQTTGILISQAAGANEYHQVKQIGKTCMSMGLLITIVVGALYVLIPKQLASLYLDIHSPENAEVLHLTILLFALTALSQAFDGIRNIVTGALRGLFDVRFPMVIGIITIWVLCIPLSYLLGIALKMGVVGVALGFAIGIFIGMVILLLRWRLMTKDY